MLFASARKMTKPLFTGLLLLTGACDDRPSEWEAFVYPDAGNLDRYIAVPGFKTFELCQQGAINILRAQSQPDSGDYECGYRCRYDPTLKTNVCKETRK